VQVGEGAAPIMPAKNVDLPKGQAGKSTLSGNPNSEEREALAVREPPREAPRRKSVAVRGNPWQSYS